MELITVIKTELVEKLKANRETHRALFLAAQERYRDAMIKELDQALEEARNGGTIRRSFAMPVPEDHTADFDTAIEMLQWDLGKTVQLSYHDFQQYVQNQWGWRASFAANTESYLAQ